MPLSFFAHGGARMTVLLASMMALAGCAASGGPDSSRVSASQNPRTQALASAMAGELAGKRRDFAQAAELYLQAARLSGDSQASERAVRFALLDDNYDLALAAAKLWTTQRPDEASARLALMRLHLRAGDMASAQGEARQYLIHQRAGLERAFSALTNSLGEESNREGAAAVMQHLAQKYPTVAEAQYSYALLAIDAGQTEAALKAIRVATAARPGWKEAQVLQSRIALRAGNVEEAMAAVQSLVADNPKDISVRLNYARMLVEQDQRDAAKKQFETVLETSKDNADALYILGLMAYEDDDTEQAKQRFLQLLKSGQRVNSAAFYLGVLAERDEKTQNAIGWYRQVNQGDSALPAQMRVASLLAKSGQVEEGLNHLRDIRSNNAVLAPRLLQAEAELLMDAGRTAEALAIHDEAVSLNPQEPDVLYSRSLAREKTGDVDGAMKDLRAILAFDDDNASALNALGYMLSNHSNRYDEALSLIKQALDQNPDEAAIIDSYGWVLFKMGRVGDAVKQLGRAYELFPDPEVAAHYGEALLALGNKTAALQVWLKALAKEEEQGDKRNEVLQETIQRLAPDIQARTPSSEVGK